MDDDGATYVKIGEYEDDAGYAMVCFESMTIKWSASTTINNIEREVIDGEVEWFDNNDGWQYSSDLSSNIEKAYQIYIVEVILLGHKDSRHGAK